MWWIEKREYSPYRDTDHLFPFSRRDGVFLLTRLATSYTTLNAAQIGAENLRQQHLGESGVWYETIYEEAV